MTKKLAIIFLVDIFIFFCALALQAQPATTGCHFAHQQVRTDALTAEEERMMQASIERSDSFDVINYDISLDVTRFNFSHLIGACAVTFTPKIEGIDYFHLDLLDLAIDSVKVDGITSAFSREGFSLIIPWPTELEVGTEYTATVYYQGTPTVSAGSFGGFYFEGGYAYNLGIDLIGEPHNFGRSWFPCFDNFVERATYDITLISNEGRRGYAVGDFIDETVDGDIITRRYRMQKQLPTYLVGVAISNYDEANSVHNGAYGDIPVQIVANPEDLDNALTSMAFLPDAIDCLEYWYGPYVWNRVGYVITTRGAMEHSSCIAYPENSIANGALSTRLMTHELCHHWWGNIITVNYAPDMWIKEGNAEYGAHLIEEFIGGDEPFQQTVKANHYFVLTTAHEEDGDYLALSPLSQENTYGRHTYYRGASMLHNMRGYLGDSLFRLGQSQLLIDNAYEYLNAQSYRDQLSTITGVDMTSFFDDWIFSPGYSDFYIHHMNYTADIDELTIAVGQNQYQSGHYHENVPLPITLLFADGRTETHRIMMSGALDSATISLVTERPIGVSVNMGNILNMAMFEHAIEVDEPGNYFDGYTKYSLNATAIVDTFTMAIEHHLTAPGGIVTDEEFRLSEEHFWHVSGTQENNFEGYLRFTYDDSAPLASDIKLTGMSEDSVVLVYREDATQAWAEYNDYQKIIGFPTDGRGFMNVENVRNGDYAFANRLKDNVGTYSIDKNARINLFPNPVREQFTYEIEGGAFDYLHIYSIDGKLVQQETDIPSAATIDISGLRAGEYIALFGNERSYVSQEFVKVE